MRPNILLIHSDQHRADCIGGSCSRPRMGVHTPAALVQTPNLDRLAQEGVNFSHAYCPIPLCTPSRASLLTGCWPAQHGLIANPETEAASQGRPALRAGQPTFSECLRSVGYFLGSVGKWGVDPVHGPLDYGFDAYIPEKEYGQWRAGQGIAPRPNTNRWFGERDPYITPAQSQLAWGADQTIHLLRAAGRRDQPFFIRWDPSEPHLPNVVPEPYASLYPPELLPPWPNFVDDLAGKPYIQRQQRRTWQIDHWNWSDWAPIVGRYLGEVTLLDEQVGRLLAALDELGLAANTVVIYTADHGDLCGGHGLIDKHYVMYEELVRVPLIIRWSGQFPAGTTVDAFVSHSIDLAATFCALAGVASPLTFAGNSLLPLLDKERQDGEHVRRPDIFAVYYGNQFGLYSQRMVRDQRWKYIWNATAEDEFYDLETDPGELVNRAGSATCAPELRRLRQRLVAWMEATQDPLLNSWTRSQLLNGNTI